MPITKEPFMSKSDWAWKYNRGGMGNYSKMSGAALDESYNQWLRQNGYTPSGAPLTTPTTGQAATKTNARTGYTDIAPSAGAEPGLPARAYDPISGGIPQVPSISQMQADAIAANLKNMAAMQELASLVNASNLAERTKQFEAVNPYFKQTLGQFGGNVYSGAQGQLSEGLQRNLQDAIAQRAVLSGMPSTSGGFTKPNVDYLRLLGTTTEELQANALNQMATLNSLTPQVDLYNPMNLGVNAEQLYNAALQASIYNSAPVPSAAREAAIALMREGLNTGMNKALAPGGYPTPSISVPSINYPRVGTTGSPSYTAPTQPNQYIPSVAPSPTYTPVPAPTENTYWTPQISNVPMYDYSTVPSTISPATTSWTPQQFNLFDFLNPTPEVYGGQIQNLYPEQQTNMPSVDFENLYPSWEDMFGGSDLGW